MSIVTIHGPYTFGSKALTANASGSAYAIVNAANGLIWTLHPTDKSQPAANYDWAYTGAAGTPPSPIADTMTPTVTFPAGAHTVTLTLNGVAQQTFTINAVAGVAPRMEPEEEAQLASQVETPTPEIAAPQDKPAALDHSGDGEVTPGTDVDVAFDPGAHTIEEVMAFVGDDPQLAREVMEVEEAGKSRVRLLSQLETLAFDPSDHTVTEVIGYVEEHPDRLDDVIEAERTGKGRVTLLTHLESMREA